MKPKSVGPVDNICFHLSSKPLASCFCCGVKCSSGKLTPISSKDSSLELIFCENEPSKGSTFLITLTSCKSQRGVLGLIVIGLAEMLQILT